MAEILIDDPRKKLYSALVSSSDKELAGQVKKYSYNKFNSLLDNNDFVQDLFMDISERGVILDPKNPGASKDPYQFVNTFVYKEPPAPKQKPATVAPPVAIEEEEMDMPEPQPAVGSPEYDAQLQAQYGGMAPTLGATFGGVPAAFETDEQKKQEQISPVFKAQQLAFEDVPIAEEQRRAQKQFAKATKQQQQSAIQGGTGFEYEQEKKRKEKGYSATDQIGAFAEGGKRIAKNILSTAGYYAQMQAATDPMSSLPEEKRQQMMQEAGQTMYDNATAAQNTFQNEITKRNIQTSVLQAIEKGQYNRIPESVLFTIGDAAMQIIPSILTFGGSTFMQTLPQAYKDGVEAIAKEKGISPEQVIASGDDGMIVSQLNSGTQSMLEFAGAGLVSKSIASRGGYKAMRDWLLSQKVNRRLAQGAALLGVGTGEAVTEYGQELTGQIGKTGAASPTTKAFFDKLPKELFTPEAKKQREEAFVGGLVGGLGLAGGGQAIQSAMDRTLFEAPKIGKATQRPDMDVVQTDNKIQERNKIAQAMEEAVKANPEAEGQIRQQYQKRINEAAPTDEEVLSAYDGLAVLPETEEKNTIRENLEAYMAEKGIQPEPTGIEAGLGEGLRVTSPVIQTVNPDFPAPQPPAPTEESLAEETPIEETPAEEEPSLEDQLMGLVPQEETVPAPAEEEVVEVAPAEEAPIEEVAAEEEAPQPKAGDFVIVNGEKGVVVVTPGGQMSVETDTKIYDLDERGIAAIGGRLVAPKEQTQTEYEVEVIDDDNAVVNGEPFKIIRDEKGNTIALQGETRTIRTEPVMVDVDIKRNKAQVTETLQEQAEEVESLSPDMTLDKQRFVDDIIGQNMTEGVDRILSEGVTEKTAEKDLLQFKLFVEATIADLRARQKGNPYAEAMIEQLQEALNTVYYEYYSQGRKAETRAAKTQKKTDRGTKGKERVSPKPAKGKQPAAPVKPTPAAPKKEEGPKGKQIDKKSVQSALEKANKEYKAAQEAFNKKKAELDKTTKEDEKNLFGQRGVEMKAKGLFEMPRISPGQREQAIQPFRDRLTKAKEEVNRLNKLLTEGEEAGKEISFTKKKTDEQVQTISQQVRQGEGPPKAKRVIPKKRGPVRSAGKSKDAIAARNITFFGDPFATSLQYLMDATYHPDLLEAIFGGRSKTTKTGKKNISGEVKARKTFRNKESSIKTADRLAEILAEKYAEENNIDIKDAEEQNDFASIGIDIISSYSTRDQMIRELLRLNEQQSDEFEFMYNPEDVYGEGYNEDIAKDIDSIIDQLPDSYWEGKEISDEEFGNLFEQDKVTYEKGKEEEGGLTLNETPSGVPYLSQSGGSDYEVPSGLQWEGDRLNGEFLSVIGQWNETNYINFTGSSYVKDASDVAEIMSQLENKSVEHMFAVHVDDKGKSHVQFLNIGTITQTPIHNQAIIAGVKRFNTKKLYLVHNHPSGNLKLSDADKIVTESIQEVLAPLKVMVDHVVLNTYKKQYSVYENMGGGKYWEVRGVSRKEDKSEEKLTTHIFNEQKLLSSPQKKVSSPIDAAEFIQQMRFTALPKSAILILNNQNEIIGNYFFVNGIDYKEILEIVTEAGIAKSVIFYGNQYNLSEVNQLVPLLKAADIRVFDALTMSSNGESVIKYYESAAEKGILLEVQEKYGTNSVPSPSSEFTSSQSSEAATAFDKAKTSKGFDKKHGKGAYKALSDITKNFEDIMDKVSDKIKQDCL